MACAGLGGEPARLARTLAALDELERACQEAERRGEDVLYHRIPLVVERQALLELEAVGKERERVLDYIYESCLRARLAMRRGGEPRRAEVPPAPELARVRLQGGLCREGDRVVFPVAVGRCPAAVRPFFAVGELARCVPALAGATAQSLEGSELWRIYTGDPGARRVGWDRPAGGFVREGALICLDHPGVRDAIARETARAIEGLRNAGWGLRGERQEGKGLPSGQAASRSPLCPLYLSVGSELFYTDYSEMARARFVGWLRERYKSVQALNTVWGTAYEEFAPGLMPSPDQAAASPSRWSDFVEFNQQRLTEHIRWAVGNVRGALPSAAIGLAPLRYAFAGSFGLSGMDPLAVTELVDVVELTGGSVMEADLAFALARGRRAVVDVSLGRSGAGTGEGEGVMTAGILWRQLHGCAAVGLGAWPPAPLRSAEAVRAAEGLLREALEARRLAPACAALAAGPRPVALLYSQASLRLTPQWALRCGEGPYSRELAVAYEAARYLDVGCTFLPSREVGAARWGGVRVLVVPGVHAEEDAVVRALVDFIDGGGHVVVIAEAFATDERGRESDSLLRLGVEAMQTRRPAYAARPRPELGGALDELVATDAAAEELRPSPDGPLARLKRPLRGSGLSQRVKVNVLHKVLATFGDGSPAIVAFERGKGSMTYIAAPLVAEDLAAVLRIVVARAGVQAAARLVHLEGAPWGVECRSAPGEGSAVLAYIWNTGGEPRGVALETAPIASALDLISGRPVAVRGDGAGAVVGPLRLAAGEVVILQLNATRTGGP
mgnify:CR=1 FL=1